MANFTINSLNSANTSASDTFMKSDTSGVLTKETAQNLANDLIALAGLTPTGASITATIGSQSVGVSFYKVGRILIIVLAGNTAITDATINQWVECGTVPSAIGPFSSCGIALPEGKLIMVRYHLGKLEYQSTLAGFWAQGCGATLAAS